MSAIVTKWESAIIFFAENHAELGSNLHNMPTTDQEKKVEFQYLPIVKTFAEKGLKSMAAQGYIAEEEIQTYLSEIVSRLDELASDNKKAAILNMVGTIGIPLIPKLIAFFKESKGVNQ